MLSHPKKARQVGMDMSKESYMNKLHRKTSGRAHMNKPKPSLNNILARKNINPKHIINILTIEKILDSYYSVTSVALKQLIQFNILGIASVSVEYTSSTLAAS